MEREGCGILRDCSALPFDRLLTLIGFGCIRKLELVELSWATAPIPPCSIVAAIQWQCSVFFNHKVCRPLSLSNLEALLEAGTEASAEVSKPLMLLLRQHSLKLESQSFQKARSSPWSSPLA